MSGWDAVRARLGSAALAVAMSVLGFGNAAAQFASVPKPSELVSVHAERLRTPQGGQVRVVVQLQVLKGWHVNANPAANENSIPTVVKLEGGQGIEVGAPIYPRPHVVKLPIDDQPLLVWDGATAIEMPITLDADARLGARTLKGKLRFQGCNDQLCLPPATLDFDAMIEVVPTGTAGTGANGSSGGAATGTPNDASSGVARGHERAGAEVAPPKPGTTAAPLPSASTFATAPPAGGGSRASAVPRPPLADLLERGGWAAFLTLFLIGLALNLTPCVYPMLGVTVSIFGARRAAPPLQVVGSALTYVLGMAAMYSALGVAAAATGGLFGGWLANPLVSIGIGVVLVALSLSMFGLYELNLPPALLARLGGTNTTSALGIFAAGLVVGLIAAPCIGAPVAALLLIVGLKGSLWFGFTSFFTLAMGLGAPYLVLGTFSNLLQRMPRSGDWMVWVKKVFGLVMLAIGLNYVVLALAPRAAAWVLPAALVLGGVWLGFLERSAARRPGFLAFQRVAGALAVAAGIAFVASAPRQGLAFEPLRSDDLATQAADRPYAIDFSADWCQPCHELERTTFANRRVIEAMRGFRLYKVDLTRFDSPESDRWRRRFEIHGVPTVVFARPGGGEVREARVEGFMPPDAFLRQVALAREAMSATLRSNGERALPVAR